MFDLSLSPEQIEFRDTVRDFVQNEVKPAALAPSRLEPFEKPLLTELLEYVSRMGLRTLSLSEAAGGAGADTLTACIVLEELAAGDVDIAMALGLTQGLARTLFEEALDAEQRNRLLPQFLDDHACHLACVPHAAAAERGWDYHRPIAEESAPQTRAAKAENGDWVIDADVAAVPNAPIARLFIVQARTDPKKTGTSGVSTFLVPHDCAGVAVSELPASADSAGARLTTRWYHGTCARVRMTRCRVPAENLVRNAFATASEEARSNVQIAAINLGVGRAAYETALDYAKIRVQGGRRIVEHQSIGALLADIAIRLELARNAIWKAAWAADHPDTLGAGAGTGLPLHTIARVYTAQAMYEAALYAAECFGAMGVMRDMPLQKYVHDAHVFLYGHGHDSATKLEIAEALAGFQRAEAA